MSSFFLLHNFFILFFLTRLVFITIHLSNCDKAFLNEQCGWDMFDCCDLDLSKIGDGTCDSGDETDYLVDACGYEEYDCCPPKSMPYVNNGNCGDSIFSPPFFIQKEELAYNKECAFEGSDCFLPEYPNCAVDVLSRIGDGVCHGGKYNSEQCGWDGGGKICFEM